MTETVLTNARVVLRDRVIKGTVITQDDRIVDVSEGRSHLSSAFDCEGDYLIPGLIELHTDNLERHVMPRPGALWPSDAAVLGHDREIAAAGITTVFNALCVGEVHSRAARVELLNEMSDAIEEQQATGALKADHFFHWRCEVSYSGMIELLEPLMDVEVVVPGEYVGDVIGDLNARRGRIAGTVLRADAQIVAASVPLSNMFGYATALRSATQGRAIYSMQFARYQEVPKKVAEEVIAKVTGKAKVA